MLKVSPCDNSVFCTLPLGPCALFPLSYSLTSSRWWISSDTIFLLFNMDSLDHQRSGCRPRPSFLFAIVPMILHYQQLFLISISNRLSQKAGYSSPVGCESHVAFGRVALFLIYIPQQVTTLEVLVLLMNYIVRVRYSQPFFKNKFTD